MFAAHGGDRENVVITGWSRGAIAVGAIGLHDDVTARLFKAFVPCVPSTALVLPKHYLALLPYCHVTARLFEAFVPCVPS